MYHHFRGVVSIEPLENMLQIAKMLFLLYHLTLVGKLDNGHPLGHLLCSSWLQCSSCFAAVSGLASYNLTIGIHISQILKSYEKKLTGYASMPKYVVTKAMKVLLETTNNNIELQLVW